MGAHKNHLIEMVRLSPHKNLKMNDQPIKEATSHKHLGIFFSNDGTWHEHIDYITSKAWSRINIMRKLKFILDRQSLETIYTSFIRPVLEYADVVWDNCTQYEINALEKIQIEAARIATEATKLVSLEMIYQEDDINTSYVSFIKWTPVFHLIIFLL